MALLPNSKRILSKKCGVLPCVYLLRWFRGLRSRTQRVLLASASRFALSCESTRRRNENIAKCYTLRRRWAYFKSVTSKKELLTEYSILYIVIVRNKVTQRCNSSVWEYSLKEITGTRQLSQPLRSPGLPRFTLALHNWSFRCRLRQRQHRSCKARKSLQNAGGVHEVDL